MENITGKRKGRQHKAKGGDEEANRMRYALPDEVFLLQLRQARVISLGTYQVGRYLCFKNTLQQPSERFSSP